MTGIYTYNKIKGAPTNTGRAPSSDIQNSYILLDLIFMSWHEHETPPRRIPAIRE